MREIKFRLRNRGNKIVGYEKWFPGTWSEELGDYLAQPCWLYSKNTDPKIALWNPTPISHRGKDQFTGLLDKNGKEIYEGDVVEFQWTEKTLIPRCHVYWWKFSCQFKLTGVHMDEDD